MKKNYLPVWVPTLQEDKRRSYIIDRSSSVVLWVLAVLSCIECVSSYLKVRTPHKNRHTQAVPC